MEVTFTRTGERRYRVTARREKAPDAFMEPAPGFDPFLPHDLVHFVVECEWRLENGIFGQLAAGGDAGTFRTVEPEERRKWRRRGERVREAAGDDSAKSEQLAHLADIAWKARRGRPLDAAELEAVQELDPATLDRVLARFDELAEGWHSLQVGRSLTLPWPWPEHAPKHGGRVRRAKRTGPSLRSPPARKH